MKKTFVLSLSKDVSISLNDADHPEKTDNIANAGFRELDFCEGDRIH